MFDSRGISTLEVVSDALILSRRTRISLAIARVAVSAACLVRYNSAYIFGVDVVFWGSPVVEVARPWVTNVTRLTYLLATLDGG